MRVNEFQCTANVNGDLSRASITKDYTFFRSKGWVTDPVDLDYLINRYNLPIAVGE